MKTAFFGEPKLKEALLTRLREHQRLDTIMQRDYFDGTKGCHLGCITHVSQGTQKETERLFGIPERVAYWLEAVFEGLPLEKAKRWVTDSIEAIPVGADLSLAHHHLSVWLLGAESPSAAGNLHPIVAEAIAKIRELHRSAAMSAAESAKLAWSAARSAAESAAESAKLAAESAESAAWSAARSAAESAARSAESAARSAESAAWEKIAAKTIEIFESCPVSECDSCVGTAFLHLNNHAVRVEV